MKKINVLVAVLVVLSLFGACLSACAVTTGDCHYRGPDDGSGDVGAGVGVAASSGPGNPGASPSGGGELPTSACNEPEDSSSGAGGNSNTSQKPEEMGLKVFCPKPEWGATCSDKCFAKSIPCVPLAFHPKKADGGNGKLFSCNDLAIGFMCGHHYDNGDDCYFPFGTPLPTLCSYSGKN